MKSVTIAMSATAKYIPLILAVSLLYTVIITTVDVHRGMKSSANCIICKFTHNLSCGSGHAAASFLSAPECVQTTIFNDYVSHYSRISLSPIGSRSPPSSTSAVEG
jgi:hypothetical protein